MRALSSIGLPGGIHFNLSAVLTVFYCLLSVSWSGSHG